MKHSQQLISELVGILSLALLPVLAVSADDKCMKNEQPAFSVSHQPTTSGTLAFARQEPGAQITPTTAPTQSEQKPAEASAATEATIYVYRLPALGGKFNKPSIYLDEKDVARIENGRFFMLRVGPGQHVVRSGDRNSAVTLEVKAGQTYYIRVTFEPAQFGARAVTMIMPPEQGWSEMGQTESTDPKYIKDHELVGVGTMPPKPVSAPATPEDKRPLGNCRSMAIAHSDFPRSGGFKVVDVVNYSGAYVGKWYETEGLRLVARDGVKILLLAKGYKPEDVAIAHNFCQSPEGTMADPQLEADITRMIRTMEVADHPGCDLQIVKRWHSPEKLGMERWEVKTCDASSSYDVEIVASPKGGSDFRVVKSILPQEKKTDAVAPQPATSQTAAADTPPQEWVPYEGQKSQFTISLPKGWLTHDQSQMPGVKGPDVNLVFFYASQAGLEFGGADDVKLLTGIDSGEIPSFFVQRIPAKNGVSCVGFSEKAEKDVFKMVTRDPIVGKGATILDAPRSESTQVGGCVGIRIRGAGQPAGGSVPHTLDVYAVSDGKVLYLFSLRNRTENYEKNVEIFQKSVATAKLTATR